MRVTAIVFLALACVPLTIAEPVRVTVRELLRNPSAYHARTVIVAGTWEWGFESSELAMVPGGTERIWLEVDRDGPQELSRDANLAFLDQFMLVTAANGISEPRVRGDQMKIEVEAIFEDAASLRGERGAGSQQKSDFVGFGHRGAYQQRLLAKRALRFSCVLEAGEARSSKDKGGEPGATDNPDDAQR